MFFFLGSLYYFYVIIFLCIFGMSYSLMYDIRYVVYGMYMMWIYTYTLLTAKVLGTDCSSTVKTKS